MCSIAAWSIAKGTARVKARSEGSRSGIANLHAVDLSHGGEGDRGVQTGHMGYTYGMEV